MIYKKGDPNAQGTARTAEKRTRSRAAHGLVEFQIQEIENAELKPDEEEELRQERTRLANAEKLASLYKSV